MVAIKQIAFLLSAVSLAYAACPQTDNDGSPLTSTSSDADFFVCNYQSARRCEYFPNGTFSSGSSVCPKGITPGGDQGGGAGTTNAPPPPPPTTTLTPPPPPKTTFTPPPPPPKTTFTTIVVPPPPPPTTIAQPPPSDTLSTDSTTSTSTELSTTQSDSLTEVDTTSSTLATTPTDALTTTPTDSFTTTTVVFVPPSQTDSPPVNPAQDSGVLKSFTVDKTGVVLAAIVISFALL